MEARGLVAGHIRTWLCALVVCLFAGVPAYGQSSGASTNHIRAELVADGPAVPGEPMTLALAFRPEPGWHGYWLNPGDAGFGMRLDWSLPPGWRAGVPNYPVPQQLVIAGLMNHVYEGPYAVLVPIEFAASGAAGVIALVSVEAQWLACTDEVCVPENARLSLRVPTATVGGGARDSRFDVWRAAIPPLIDAAAHFSVTATNLRIGIPLPASLDLARPHVFIAEDPVVAYAAPQTFRRAGDMLVAEIPRSGTGLGPERVTGILALDGDSQGIRFEAVSGAVPTGGELVDGSSARGNVGGASLWVLAAGALAGGLILNLMPCVFPILSLKALTLARAGESEMQARREGLAYTGGVMLACIGLGALLLALRAGGSEIGWAFQLQEPGVVLALLVLCVMIAASFAGLYELPSLSITRSGGQIGAFATGLLAAFVATPCTGPFMAAALGAALLLPWEQALLLFAALGLGLALPFLLLGFVPPLRRLLPKPGPWMNRFRKALAVPMALTAAALAWLCWRLGGIWFAVLGLVLAVQVVLVLTAWCSSGGRQRGMVAAGIAMLVLVMVPQVYAPPAEAADSVLEPEPYSTAALTEARASGQPVFLWFTADWCLTCKVNENVAIEREATRAAFDGAGVITMRGDWTRRDPAITRFLTEHGVAGVPLYLWYPAGGAKSGKAEQLPQVLAPDSLVKLARAG